MSRLFRAGYAFPSAPAHSPPRAGSGYNPPTSPGCIPGPLRTEFSAIAPRRAATFDAPARVSREGVARPFLKWAGGKTQLVPELVARAPRRIDTYFEPFIGGGAMFFALAGDPGLAPRRAVLNDANRELVTVYEVVRDEVERLVRRLQQIADPYLAADADGRAEAYYAERERAPQDRLDTAARFIFLNKTCFNGLYRVNRRGEFNVPHGRYLSPRILDESALRSASVALHGVAIHQGDFAEAVAEARAGDFVYFDPPFDPLSKTSSFTGYTEGAFDRREQTRLKFLFEDLTDRGVSAMLSNSSNEWILGAYQTDRRAFHVELIPARRAINSRGDRRGAIDEVVVTNYSPELSRRRLESAAADPSSSSAAPKPPRGTGSTK